MSEATSPTGCEKEPAATKEPAQETGDSRQVQELQEQLQRARAELEKEVHKNLTLEKSLKDQKSLIKDMSTQQYETTALLQKKEDGFQKEVKKLWDLLQIQVLKNEMLEQSLKEQKSLIKDMSTQRTEATALLQQKEDYIEKQVMSNKELRDELQNQVHKNGTLEQSLQAQQRMASDMSSKLKNASVLLQKNEGYIKKKVFANAELTAELKKQVQKNQTLEQNLKAEQKLTKDKSAELKMAKLMYRKEEQQQEELFSKIRDLKKRLSEAEEDKETLINRLTHALSVIIKMGGEKTALNILGSNTVHVSEEEHRHHQEEHGDSPGRRHHHENP